MSEHHILDAECHQAINVTDEYHLRRFMACDGRARLTPGADVAETARAYSINDFLSATPRI